MSPFFMNHTNSISRLGFLLLATAYLQPLHILPWLSWQSESFAFSSLICIALSVLIDSKQSAVLYLRIPILSQLWFIPIAWVTLQWCIGQITFAGDILIFVTYFIACMVAVCVGYQWKLVNQTSTSSYQFRESALQQLAITLLLVSILSAVVALAQTTQATTIFDEWIMPSLDTRRPGGNMGQPNHLATLLLMGCISTVFLYENRSISRYTIFPILTLLIIGLAITESRTAIVSVISINIWCHLKKSTSQLRSVRFGMAVFLILMISAMWCWPYLLTAFHAGGVVNAKTVIGVNTVVGSRFVVWPQLVEAISMHPWIGWGFGSVSKAQNMISDKYDISEPFTYAHNIILDLAVGCGLPVTLIIIGAATWWVLSRFSRVDSVDSWYCATLLIPIGVHSQFEFPFAYAYFLLPAMFMVGSLEANFKPQRDRKVTKRALALLIVGYTFLLGWITSEYIKIEEDFRIARFEALRVGVTPATYSRPSIHLLTQLDTLLQATRTTPNTHLSATQIQLLRDASLRFPWSALQNRYAMALALNGNATEAVRQLKVIRAMHGERMYALIKVQWDVVALEKFPMLKGLAPV